MQIIKQCDKRWAGEHLGTSSRTLCSDGCLTTDLSSLSSWFGKYINPGELVKKLQYTPEGYLIWKSIDGALPFKFVWRYYTRDDVKIKQILNSKDGACILQVNNKKHWVVVVGFSRLSGFKIFDPYYGDIVYLNKRYPNITGFAEVTR